VVLSLDELNLTPDWMKAPAKSFDRHPGEAPDRKRDLTDRRGPPRNRRGPKSEGGGGPRRDRPPRKPASGRPAPRPAGPPAPPPPPLPVDVTFVPHEPAFGPMIETLKQTARAYALFDLAKLVLNKPDRHNVKLTHKDGQFHLGLLTGGVFLSQEEAVRSSLRHGAGKLFTAVEKPVDPPKGNFQFVNRCGLTGEILGPPNFHEYQTRLVKHHQQRLAHLPFDRFKSRIETIHDPEAVKAWVESRSKTTEYTCLLDAEPKVFTDRSDLEKHVRQNHLDKIVATVGICELTGVMARQVEDRRLLEAIRRAWESERRFPIKTVNELRPLLVKAGLHFFKHKKGITYLSRIKPNRFDSISHLTEHVQKIITYLRAHPDATRKQLAAHLAPVDENLLAADLHWLIQDGYVIEFYDGKLWALDDRPPKPAPVPATEPAPAPAPNPAESAPILDASTTAAPPAAVAESAPVGENPQVLTP
jgi:hypothetical protein